MKSVRITIHCFITGVWLNGTTCDTFLKRSTLQGELYEFKVSYPATQPYTFTISFSNSPFNLLVDSMPQRKLLDIEKEEFVPISDTIHVLVSYYRVLVSVFNNSTTQLNLELER